MSFPAGQEEPAARNRLGQERSPYLRQHADNPVDWHPWGEEAFRRARDEDKPIFLSIGYSTCHWCHVMEEESFMNDGIARLLNERFVPIKVDREERPDVDQLYMTYVQASTGHGGWPMSVWLTPDLEPFVGATYFPPERFREVLEQIARVWREDRRRVTGAAREALDFLRRAGAPAAGGSVEVAALDAGRAWFERTYDRVRGGFGNAPKFPRPSELLFLLREHHRTGAGSARDMVLHALRAMARGGIHDHVGGGFHRYSVDERWHVPHFEKMLYDQAQLVAAYVEAWQLTGDEAHAAVARDILEYVLRRLTHADGGFFSAEDADTEHVEGATYVWTRDELEAALGDQTEEFCRRYGVRRDGNVSRGADIRGEMAGRNVLFLTEGAEPMPGALARLAEVRDRRPQPHRDDKVIAAWNGLMIGAFARAGFALDESRYVDAAARAGRFLWERLRVDGDLRRHWLDGPAPAPAVTADHAMVVQGFLDLYEATFDDIWISRALELQAEMDARFADAEGAGYFESRADPSLLVRTKELYDGAEPAANSVAALNLLRLERITGDRAWGRRAAGTLSLYASADAASAPYAMMAAQFQREGPLEIVFTGDAGPLVDVLRRRFVPHKVVLRPTALAPWTCLLASHEGTAFVCRNFACDLPATTPEELAERLGRAR